jgi:dihydrodipicolinate synthase/N-acetylneuraminate lyase
MEMGLKALLTPLDERSELNAQTFGRLMRYGLETGVHSAAFLGGTIGKRAFSSRPGSRCDLEINAGAGGN